MVATKRAGMRPGGLMALGVLWACLALPACIQVPAADQFKNATDLDATPDIGLDAAAEIDALADLAADLAASDAAEVAADEGPDLAPDLASDVASEDVDAVADVESFEVSGDLGGADLGSDVTAAEIGSDAAADGEADASADAGGCKSTCDDGDPCTEDSCDADAGCQHVASSGAPCDDDNPCTLGDTCAAGNCAPGKAKECTPPASCLVSKCDVLTGKCKSAEAVGGTPCDDQSACTDADICKSGFCQGAPIDCNDGEPCTKDGCDPASGCTNTGISAKPCDDGNPCTLGDACVSGKCGGGKPKECSSPEACIASKCDSVQGGKCKLSNIPEGGACSDGSACTGSDACLGGACFGVVVNCDDGNACTIESCNAKSGCATTLSSASCNDGDPCTPGDACTDGACVGQAGDVTVLCDDDNACTTDACTALSGCIHTANTAPCDDGNPCTTADVCMAGACTSGENSCACAVDGDCTAKNDDNPCNGTLYCNTALQVPHCQVQLSTVVVCDQGGGSACLANRCNPISGLCEWTPSSDGRLCDADGSVCTQGDACVGGACQAGAPLGCDDNNACTTDSCHAQGGCQHNANTFACDADGNACTQNDACKDKVCLAGPKKVCDDGQICTYDACDPKSGICGFDGAALDGTVCDADGSLCTAGDACQGGACAAGSLLACNDDNPCTDDSCDNKLGCVSTPNKQPCNDGNACTGGDGCAQGACSGVATSPEVACDDSNPCTSESCDPKLGCQHAANLVSCEDGNPCTQGDTCAAGACAAGTNVCTCATDADCQAKEDGDLCNGTLVCNKAKAPFACQVDPATVVSCDSSGDSACQQNVCAPASGTCAMVAVANGKPCDDGSVCTSGDACAAGKCMPGSAAQCDDKNPCTDDACDNVLGCGSTANSGACSDGNACTTGDGCKDGLCVPGAAASCDDGKVCTVDSCDAATACVHTASSMQCTDGNACTVGDSCMAGSCVAGVAAKCDDGNPCTADSCDASKGCVHAASAGGCDDGNPCTLSDVCADGSCLGGSAVLCSASDACHEAGTCNVSTGACSNPIKVNGALCNDANACTQTDTCQGGKCSGVSPVVCVAADACHDAGVCDAATGACSKTAKAAGSVCDDGDACTTADACAAGVCVGGAALNCDDGNACTQDSCDKVGGCKHGAVANPPAETCNGLDDNCNGVTDDGCDDDNDDYCDAAMVTTSAPTCAKGGGDCDDTALAVHPGAVELCNGIDDNCVGGIDEGCKDVDGDGFCPGVEAISAECPSGGGDCDNGNADIHPGVAEVCNGKDDNCDGQTDVGATCTDNDLCTLTDSCVGGGCVGSNPVLCTAQDACHDAGTCNPTSGTCSNPSKGNGALCEDGNACTLGDNCQGGSCTGGTAKICAALDSCHEAGLCDSSSGSCSNPIKADGAGCDDGNGCTQTDACQAGSCKGSNPKTCDALDQCHMAGTCLAETGVCTHPTKSEGTPCNDDSACTQDDVCLTGSCIGFAVSCDDGNACTVDSCVAQTGCAHLPAANATPEQCNGVDDNCSGSADEGCDDDKDGYCDASMVYTAGGASACSMGPGDTDDTDPLINPAAVEICDNKDNNSNGATDEGCDDDGDGWCDSTLIVLGKPAVCLQGSGDCDDAKASVNPGAQESCLTAYDDNCDGSASDINAVGCTAYYFDADKDGFGIGSSRCLCAAAGLYTAMNGLDCDDANLAVHPSATEVCNGFDDNCDGTVDEAGATGCQAYLLDADHDGYGVTGNSKCLCSAGWLAPNYTATDGGDCNDNSSSAQPGAKEKCNNLDDNCDGTTDEINAIGCALYYYDADQDGFGTAASQCACAPAGPYGATKSGDCNDSVAAVHPGASEACDNSDENCDGVTDAGCDDDQDGYCDAAMTKAPGVSVGACPLTAQGATTGDDCNDVVPDVHPGVTEICDNVDNNCAGFPAIDEGCDDDNDNYCDATMPKAGGIQVTTCTATATAAFAGDDCNDAQAATRPNAVESCDNADNNCSGATDEGCDNDNDDYCDATMAKGAGITVTTCASTPAAAFVGDDCDDSNQGVRPGAVEVCDGINNNCNAGVDEECDQDGDTYCAASKTTIGKPVVCPSGGGDCDDMNNQVSPGRNELCDNVDNNCSGATDEGCDSDGDDYCHSAMITIGFPLVCPFGGGDCADNNPAMNPGGVEICDNIDNRCFGVADWGCDDDNDNYCDAAMVKTAGVSVSTCSSTPTAATAGDDCNDAVAAIKPGATEVCDNLDNNCSSGTDEGCDDDNDDYCDAGMSKTAVQVTTCKSTPTLSVLGDDCNDTVLAVHPGATEICDNIDNNCAGLPAVDEGCDDDNDNFCDSAMTKAAVMVTTCTSTGAAVAGDDCDDSDAAVHPGQTEVCSNGKDDNCDGSQNAVNALGCMSFYVDADLDGYGNSSAGTVCQCTASGANTASVGDDCNDTKATIHPGLAEACNGVDDNCSGAADEGTLCEDGNVCQSDTCTGVGGCTHANVAGPCGTASCSGLAFTAVGSCSVGSCASNLTSCDDGDPCTIDACSAATGCANVAAADGTACATGKVCMASACTATPVPPAGMVWIPAGTSWMGCNAAKDPYCPTSGTGDEIPQRKVTLSSYYIDQTETTVAQYKACYDAGGTGCTAPGTGSYATWPSLSGNPANFVTWAQAQAYCKWRGASYDLPTEAQWEMAARGSCEQNGSSGSDPACAAAMRTYPWGETQASCTQAVLFSGSAGCGANATAAVGSKTAGDSPYGLHDMAGNVSEWVRDWYAATYASGSATDPLGPGSGTDHPIRGSNIYGSWHDVRASSRDHAPVATSSAYVGLRCVRPVCASAADCDDGNPCTTDTCAASGCGHGNVADWTPCGTGKVCNGSGSCLDTTTSKGMAFIPTGTFWMGCNASKDASCAGYPEESPQHKVTLSAYYMDLTETTVEQYKACVTASVCTAPSSVQPAQYATYPGLTTNPVNFVNYAQMQAYCKWRGAAYDLPTEAQWEMAARGSCEKNGSTAGDAGCAAAMRTYPWGEATATCSYAVMPLGGLGCGTGNTWAVGSILAGDSPYGPHDMAGNVWEWTGDWYASPYTAGAQTDPVGPGSGSYRVIRGGSFGIFSDAVSLRAGKRGSGAPPSFAVDYLGGRCVRTYP